MLCRYALETQEVIVYPGLATQVNFTLATEGSEGSNEGQVDIPLDEWAAQYDFSIAQNFSGYQTNDDLTRVLLEYQGSYPDIIDLSPLGQTRSGTSMWMLEMGTNRKVDNVIDIPRVALIGGLRGEEPVGRELLWRFIHHLGEGITHFMNTCMKLQSGLTQYSRRILSERLFDRDHDNIIR